MIQLVVNGHPREIEAAPETRLVTVLRETLGLRGTRYGCGQGRCGACTIIVDGIAVRSCETSLQAVEGREILTIEGIGAPEQPTPVQAAVRGAQACQCGHCASGMIMAVTALLARTPHPAEARIRDVLSGHECMCGSRGNVVRAILRLTGIPLTR